jgi:hypothetical protein
LGQPIQDGVDGSQRSLAVQTLDIVVDFVTDLAAQVDDRPAELLPSQVEADQVA